jgi:hypothetical protein
MLSVFRCEAEKLAGDKNFHCGAFLHFAWIFQQLDGAFGEFFLCGTMKLIFAWDANVRF